MRRTTEENGSFRLAVTAFETAWGPFRLAATVAGVAAVGLPAADAEEFYADLRRRFPGFLFVEQETPETREARRQVQEYLAGERRALEVPFHIRATPFQFKAYEAISLIPYGGVATYGDIARRIGLGAGGARAVGGACAANPIPLIVPCHRVVAARGLGGFAGGLDLKRKLLALEGVSL
jgi:methylated-DNA-[protein]-cysteine S-methyltransferase